MLGSTPAVTRTTPTHCRGAIDRGGLPKYKERDVAQASPGWLVNGAAAAGPAPAQHLSPPDVVWVELGWVALREPHRYLCSRVHAQLVQQVVHVRFDRAHRQ